MIFLYMHAGSYNHGCEAIVRSTVDLIDDQVKLFSEYPREDIDMGLNELCCVSSQGHSRNKNDIGFIGVKAAEIIFGPRMKYEYLYKNVFSVRRSSLFLSIGGDNYCYDNNKNLAYINNRLHSQGHYVGLWGCSIEPSSLSDGEILKDLKLYDFITARESITYRSLIDAGLKNTFLVPDTAFFLNTMKCPIPDGINGKKIVGINTSSLVEKIGGEGLLKKSYENLIEWIVKKTDYNIMLIPHVCKERNDDRLPLRSLFEKYENSGRIILINKDGTMNCSQLKYLIGKCHLMVAARTHASIAAYSQMIPTVVVGYSVKAKGIACDLFGEEHNHYVLDSRHIKTDNELVDMFREMMCNEGEIREALQLKMKYYEGQIDSIKDIIGNQQKVIKCISN